MHVGIATQNCDPELWQDTFTTGKSCTYLIEPVVIISVTTNVASLVCDVVHGSDCPMVPMVKLY